MFMNKMAVLIFCCILILPGCGYPPLRDDTELPTDYTYKIGPGDSIQIFVWGYPEVSTTATVRPDGKITTPLIDDVEVMGRTPYQLAREMEVILGEYVRDPQVAIIVGGFQGVYEQQVRILQTSSGIGGIGGGSGGGSGGKALPYKKGMTLLDLMIQTGGIGIYSDGNRASIIREVDGEQKQFGIRIDDLMNKGDLTANVKIMPGDILIIPESFF